MVPTWKCLNFNVFTFTHLSKWVGNQDICMCPCVPDKLGSGVKGVCASNLKWQNMNTYLGKLTNLSSRSVFLSGWFFYSFLTKKQISAHTKEFCEEGPSFLQILKNQLSDFYSSFMQIAKIWKDSYNLLLSYMVYSQIWVTLFAVDHQFGYITKLKRKPMLQREIFLILIACIKYFILMTIHLSVSKSSKSLDILPMLV
jgi:hypothetical protein